MVRLGVALSVCCLSACTLETGGLSPRTRDAAVVVDTAMADVAIEDTPIELDTAIADTVEAKDSESIFDAPSPLPGCSVGFRLGHEYLFCEREANWEQAQTTCRITGYELAIISDKPEHDFVLGQLKSKAKSQFHIGLSDRADEGTFVWADGSKPAFTSWAGWQPDNWLLSEDCVVLRKDGTWNDVDCTGGPREGFVCESL